MTTLKPRHAAADVLAALAWAAVGLTPVGWFYGALAVAYSHLGDVTDVSMMTGGLVMFAAAPTSAFILAVYAARAGHRSGKIAVIVSGPLLLATIVATLLFNGEAWPASPGWIGVAVAAVVAVLVLVWVLSRRIAVVVSGLLLLATLAFSAWETGGWINVGVIAAMAVVAMLVFAWARSRKKPTFGPDGAQREGARSRCRERWSKSATRTGSPARSPDESEAGRRERVLATALLIFARYGYRKASMEDVARAADISRPGLYFYFASKPDLFRAAIIHALDGDVAAAGRCLSGTDRPLRDRLIEAFYRWTGRYVGPMTKDVAIMIENNPGLLGPMATEYPKRFAKMVTDALTAGTPADRGDIAGDVAQTLLSTANGIKHEAGTAQLVFERVMFQGGEELAATEDILRGISETRRTLTPETVAEFEQDITDYARV